MINWTNIEHALYALAIQLSLGMFMGWWAAGAMGVMFLAGREYAQAEYKASDDTFRSLTNMQPWHLFNRKYWSLDALMDVAVPAVAVSIAAYAGVTLWPY